MATSDPAIRTATIRETKTHLSRMLRDVEAGATIVILNGRRPVARLVPVDAVPPRRPKVGTCTSLPVTVSDDAFEPLPDADLAPRGL